MERVYLFIDVLAYITAITTGVILVYQVFIENFVKYLHLGIFVISLSWALSGLN